MDERYACLTPEIMQRYVHVQLSKELDEQVERHLGQCFNCLEGMLALVDSDPFFQAAANSANFDKELAASAGNVTALLAKLENLRNQGLFGDNVPAKDSPPLPDPDPFATVSADLLTPPRSPGELGWIGNICVKAQIGHGGMGVVYRAEDTALKREIAIKAILPQYAHSKNHRQRFLREARSVAAVEHPNIVAIYQVGENNGYPFIVMPFLQGQSLQDRLKPRLPLPIAEAVRIGKEVALGLAAAHERGLVHRDIKPSNIWLEAGPQGTVKILDFGLARLPEMLLDGTVDKTQDGTVLGTPEYMSPEQARGKPVDYRTDLYSLGVLLYRLTTGQLPFTAAMPQGYLVAHASETPGDLPLRAPEIPPAFGKLIMQLLEKKPARRPESALAVVGALEKLDPGQKTTLQFTKRQVLSLAAAAVLIALFGIWQVWLSWSGARDNSPTALPQSAKALSPDEKPPKKQFLITTLLRPDKKPRMLQSPQELADQLPLRPGDQLELTCELPKGYQGAFFLIDSNGNLQRLEPVEANANGTSVRIRFPARGIWNVEGPAGTILFLACAAPYDAMPDVWHPLKDVFGLGKGPLPAPKEDVLFVLDRWDLQPFGEVSRDVIETPYSRLRDRLEQLRNSTWARFDFVWGVALPVR